MKQILLLWLLATSFLAPRGYAQVSESKPTVFTLLKKSNVSGLQKTLDSLNLAIRNSGGSVPGLADSLAKRPTLVQGAALYKPFNYQPDTNSVVGLRIMFGRQADAINLLQLGVNTGFLGLTNAINERVRKVDADGYYKPNSYTPPIGSKTVAGLVKAGTNVDIASDGTLTVTAPGSTTLADVNPNPGTVGSGTVVPVITFDTKGRATNTGSAPITPGGIGANAVMSMAQARLISGANPPQAISITDAGRAGLFTLRSGNTDPDDGALTIRAGALAYKRETQVITPAMFGAVNDTTVDNTDPIRRMFLAGPGYVAQIDKRYKVTTGQILVPSGVIVEGTPTGELFTYSTSGNILSASSQQGITLRGLRFKAPNGYVKALYVSYCSRIVLDHLSGTEVGFVRAEHSDIFDVDYPDFRQYKARSGPACFDESFCWNIDMDHPTFIGYGFSFQWWGGESAPEVNGVKTSLARSTPKATGNIYVHNATFKNSIAPFWGSLGDNIVLDGKNLIEDMEDVGGDAELSSRVKVSGFTIRGVKRGALAMFYNSDDVTFENGEVYCAVGDTAFVVRNGNSNIDAGRLTIRNVRFYSTYPQQTGYLDGSAKELIVQDNYFENVYLDVAKVAGRSQLIEKNTFVNTLVGSPTMLQVGNLQPEGSLAPSLVVRNNVFKNQYALATNQKLGRAFQIFHLDEYVEDVIEQNETYGFEYDALSQPQSAGVATAKKARIRARNNVFGSNNLFANPTGTTVGFLLDNNNNRDANGSFIGANATSADQSKAMQGNSAQSRTTLNANANDDKPSGVYNYLGGIGGISSGIGNILGMEWRHENGSGSGGFWMKRLFSDLNTDAFLEQTKFGDGRGFNTPMRLHSDRSFPINHSMSPATGQVLAWNGSTWSTGTSLDNKVDKVSGKDLSTNDYVTADKNRVAALGTASTKDAPTSGTATSTQVVMGSDPRLTDARNPTSHSHSAGDITAGTMAPARLGTGTASASTVLYGDGTWKTAPTSSTGSGGSAGSYNQDELNGFLLGTDRLIDVRETGGMSRNQGYFHQVIATRSVQVGGVSFKITRGGSVSGSTYQNAVGLYDTNGNLLAIGDARSVLGSSGWKKVMFDAPFTLVAGTKYLIGIVANGDDIPNFAAAQSYSDYNQFAPTTLLRNFRKSNVTSFNQAMNFATDVSANTDARIFLSLIAP